MEKMDQVQASKAVLIEVMNVLGLYRNHLILVGGWVPELLLPNHGHMGSLDVDLAVDVRGISRKQYDSILYFCLKHFSAGVAELARLCRPLLHNGLVQEGIAILHEKFSTIDSVGPTWAAEVAEENGADRQIAQREAFELMKDFLAAIAEQQADGA